MIAKELIQLLSIYPEDAEIKLCFHRKHARYSRAILANANWIEASQPLNWVEIHGELDNEVKK